MLHEAIAHCPGGFYPALTSRMPCLACNPTQGLDALLAAIEGNQTPKGSSSGEGFEAEVTEVSDAASQTLSKVVLAREWKVRSPAQTIIRSKEAACCFLEASSGPVLLCLCHGGSSKLRLLSFVSSMCMKEADINMHGNKHQLVVLCWASQVDLSGRVDALELVEALQDRDRRPYQLFLRMPDGRRRPSRPAR